MLKRHYQHIKMPIVPVLFFWAFLLLSMICLADSSLPTTKPVTVLETAHFQILSSSPNIKNLQFHGLMCEEALKQLAPDSLITTSNKRKPQVQIIATAREFHQISGMQPENTMAVALPDKGIMILNAEALGRADPSERYRTIRHEMVHLLLGYIAGGDANVPSWLHEGLAQLLSGQHDLQSSLRLAWANITNRRIPMERLINSFPYNSPQSDLAYAQSMAFTQFVLTKKLSYSNPEHFFSDMLRNPDKAKIFFARLSDRDIVASYDGEWHGESKGARNWILVLTSGGLLWGLLTVLFLIAYYLKRRSQQTVVQSWDPWERENRQDEEDEIWEEENIEEDDEDEKWKT